MKEICTSDLNEIDKGIKLDLQSQPDRLQIYILRTHSLIKDYKNNINTSKKVVFGNKGIKKVEMNNNLEVIIKNYLIIAKEYIKINISQDKPTSEYKCIDCNNPIYNDNDIVLCKQCGRLYSNFIFNTSYNDFNRVNVAGNFHNRESQFEISIMKRQGLYPVENGEQVIQYVSEKCKLNNINMKIIEDKTIRQLLNEGKFKDNYSDIPWIKWQLTSIKPTSLEPIKATLMDYYRKFSSIYYKVKDPTKQNYLNNDYILTRFIILINHPKCKLTIEDLENTLGHDRISEYENIIESFCNHFEIHYVCIC